ncbi:AAA family ATPase [Lentzea sp. NPDC004789]
MFSALLIGGRSGVGKSTVAWEISAQLQAASVAHCFVEGDFLDQAHPAPPDDPHRTEMTRRNLASLWGNYAALGYRRLIYTNTVSVLERDLVVSAMGGNVDVTAVLLTAEDEIANQRLSLRETGSQYDAHVTRGVAAARHLETNAPGWVVRVPTDGKGVAEVASEIIALWGVTTPH